MPDSTVSYELQEIAGEQVVRVQDACSKQWPLGSPVGDRMAHFLVALPQPMIEKFLQRERHFVSLGDIGKMRVFCNCRHRKNQTNWTEHKWGSGPSSAAGRHYDHWCRTQATCIDRHLAADKIWPKGVYHNVSLT
ncbi:hypothetical protein KIPB_006369 [Kipferlia bialata]|uniref:Uncharacterized protein n=1 Tax=Kipferlia bialata TaxID=797122 RepID=A0A391NWP2_9EUKA|nr:hypothetical protein KIPB_006369 [Kipferlia bialata]|eukprot:g6369.t1